MSPLHTPPQGQLRARRRERTLRVLALAALTFAGITCRDGSVTGPGLPRWGRATLAPRLQVARSGPVIRLDAVRALLVPIPSSNGAPALDTVARFGVRDTLAMELSLPVTNAQQEFELRIAATDLDGDTVYRAIDTVRLSIGAEPPPPLPVALFYAGPDTVVAGLEITPRDTQFVVGDSMPMRAVARRDDESVVPTARLGWAVSDSAVASISTTGVLRATTAFTGVKVFVGTANGRIDSTFVSAFVPVRRVVLAPPTATLAVGDTLATTVVTYDRNDVVLTGRAVTYAALGAGATVTQAGLVIGAAVGTVSVVASSEGVADTSVITVVRQPVASLAMTPDTARVVRGDSLDLVVVLRDRLNNVLTGREVAFASTDAAVATVSDSGRVRVLASTGLTRVIATSEGRADTTVLLAQPRPAATVTLSPDSLVLLPGQQGVLTALPLDAQGQPAPDLGLTWTSLDPGIATVQASLGIVGEVTAVAVGSARIVASVGAVADTVVVRVRAAATELRISPRADTLFIPALGNDTLQLAAQAYDGGTPVSATIAWVSRAPDVATVDSLGMVRSVAQGLAWIVATESQAGLTDSVLVGVRQVITRIAVSPSPFTIGGLQNRYQFTAVAYDRNDVAVTVPGFIWSISNTAVALLVTPPLELHPVGEITSYGNGTVELRATSNNVTGAATITIQQQLGAVSVDPQLVNLSAGGVALLTATPRDVNFYPMQAPVAVSFASDNPAVATVDPVSGLVTGVSEGIAHVTATAAGFTSEQVTINVVSLAIQFEADTIAVGSRTFSAFAVRLSAPSSEPVVVQLQVAEAGRVTVQAPYEQLYFPAGITQQVVGIVGEELGSVQIRALQAYAGNCDGRCPPLPNAPYRPDTATVLVVAGMQLEARPEIAEGDSAYTQLALQTPAPAGGLRVVFDYDEPAILRVVPDTVIVPAGHLAADVLLRTLALGAVRITPRVVGAPEPPGIPTTIVVGRAPMEIISDLGIGQPLVIGAGQVDEVSGFLLFRVPPSNSLTAFGDGTVGRVRAEPIEIRVGAGQPGAAIGIGGTSIGIDTLRVTAPLFGLARRQVFVTTPGLQLWRNFIDPADDDDTLVVSGPDDVQSLVAVVTDSLGRRHDRALPLLVRLSSSDSTILLPLATVGTIDGAEFGEPLNVRGLRSGTATLTLTADGHTAGTRTFVVRLPKLTLTSSDLYSDTVQTVAIARGRRHESLLQWYSPTFDPNGTVLSVRHTNPAVATSDAVVSSPYGSGSVSGLRTLSPGIDTVIISGEGFEPDTLVLAVGGWRVRATPMPDTLQVGQVVQSTLLLEGGGVADAAIGVRVRSLNPAALAIDDVLTIAAGASTTSFGIQPTAGGETDLELSVGGEVDTSYHLVVRSSKLVAVVSGGGDETTLGISQLPGNDVDPRVRVQVLDRQEGSAAVFVTTPEPAIVSVPDTALVVSSDGGWQVAVPLVGLARGRARVVFAADGYEPDTITVDVVPPTFAEVGYSRFAQVVPAGTSQTWDNLALTDSATAALFPWIFDGAQRGTASALQVRVRSSTPSVAPLDTVVRVEPGSGIVPPVIVPFVGAGTTTLTVEEVGGTYQPLTRQVTAVARRLTWDRYGVFDRRLSLGTRQRFQDYQEPEVCTSGENPSALRVEVSSSDGRVALVVTDTLELPASSGVSCASVRIDGGDSTGTVAIVARTIGVAGWLPDTLRLAVGRPTLVESYPLDTLWTGDTTGVEIVFFTADQFGNARLNLDPLTLLGGTIFNGIIAVRDPAGVFVVPPDEGGAIYLRVAGVQPGRDNVTLQDMRSEVPEWRRYAYGLSSTMDVAPPYFRLSSDGFYPPTARQVAGPWVLFPPRNFTVPFGDEVHVGLNGSSPELQLPDSVVFIGGFGYPPVAFHGLGAGQVATIVTEAFGFRRDTTRLAFLAGRLAFAPLGATTFAAGDSVPVEVRAMDANGYVVQRVTQSQSISLQLPAGLQASNGATRVASVTIAAGEDRTTIWLVGTAAGDWRVNATHPDFQPFTSQRFTVIAPPDLIKAGSRE